MSFYDRIQNVIHPCLAEREGITAMILNRDEPTFEESITSIAPHVDEIIVSDASTHDYLEVRQICEELGAKLYLMDAHYPTQANFVYNKVKTRWALRWDADFVTMPKIDQLFSFVEALRLGPVSYAIEFGVYDEENDDEHFEVYLFTIRDDLLKPRIRKMARNLNSLVHGKPIPRLGWMPFPIDYKVIKLRKCYAYHRQRKPNWKIKERKYQLEWGLLSARERGGTTFEEYVKKREKDIDKHAC